MKLPAVFLALIPLAFGGMDMALSVQQYHRSWTTGRFRNCAALSPDGQFVAGGGDGVVLLYRLTP